MFGKSKITQNPRKDFHETWWKENLGNYEFIPEKLKYKKLLSWFIPQTF